MSQFEHFYIKDPESGYNGWDHVYTHLCTMQMRIHGLDIARPASFRNRDAFTFIKACSDFLLDLCLKQAVRVTDFNPRLTVLSNTARSVLSMFEDDRMDDMTPERCQEIKTSLDNNLDAALDQINIKKHVLPVEKTKTEAATILEDKSDSILTVNDSYDNFSDAMRLMLRRMTDEDAEGVKKLLSPQERLFFDVREQSQKTIANFSTAAIKAQSGKIQFARGTLAVQGRIDRKGLKFIPEHHVVQMAGTAMCPGFSSRDSDIQAPTFFLHNQRFIVFNPDLVSNVSFHVSDTRLDKVWKIRNAVMANSKARGYRDVLESPLKNKLFPKLYFVWLADEEAAQKLDIKSTVKAELAF